MVRERVLVHGARCRRCGGELRLEEDPAEHRRRAVVAVRAAVGGDDDQRLRSA